MNMMMMPCKRRKANLLIFKKQMCMHTYRVKQTLMHMHACVLTHTYTHFLSLFFFLSFSDITTHGPMVELKKMNTYHIKCQKLCSFYNLLLLTAIN